MNNSYYLEPNSLRKLNKNLNSIKDFCFTSSYAIFELISGIKESDYNIRKAVITNLLKEDFPIIWSLPSTLTARAFPPIDYIDKKEVGLKEISNCLAKSNSFDDFVSLSKDFNYNLKYFKELDNFYSKKFIDATMEGNQNLKKIINNENPALPKKFSKDLLKNLPQLKKLNMSITLMAIVNDLVNGIKIETGKQFDEEKVYDLYNGKINIYIEAFSLFTATKSAELNQPSKNDFVDLNHLIYLSNSNKKFIVTDDKMILSFTENAIKIDDFKKILN
jgi:hypothetical protein